MYPNQMMFINPESKCKMKKDLFKTAASAVFAAYMFLISGSCLMLCGCGEDAPASKSNSYTAPNFKKQEPASDPHVQLATTPVAQSKNAHTAQGIPRVQPGAAPYTGVEVAPFQIEQTAEIEINIKTEQALNPDIMKDAAATKTKPLTAITAVNANSGLAEFSDKDMKHASTVNIRNKDFVNEQSVGVSRSGKTSLICKSTQRPQAGKLEKTWDTSIPLEEDMPVDNVSNINLVPKVIADYKLAEYCANSKVLNSIIGKTITVTGMVLQVNKTVRGPKLEMFKSRILCFPKNMADSSFNNISSFYETGIRIQENKASRYIGFLIKATVRGTAQRGVKMNSIEIVDSEVLAWYGVEVLIWVGSTELSHACKEDYRSTSIRYNAEGKLRFNIVAGFSSPIKYYRRQEKEKELSGFVFQSDETFEGVLIKINPDLEKTVMVKEQFTMDSDPLCLGRELHMINEILHRKGYANKFVVKADVNPMRRNLFKNGNVTQWECMDEDIGLYPISTINYANETELLTADNGFPVDAGNK